MPDAVGFHGAERVAGQFVSPPWAGVIDPLSDLCPTPGILAETIHALNELAARREIAIVVTLWATGRFDSRGRLEVRSKWPTDAAQCAWFVAVDPEDDSRRIFVPTRTNSCAEPQGLDFWIKDGRVRWDVAGRIDFQVPLQNLSGAGLCLSQLLAEGGLPSKTVECIGSTSTLLTKPPTGGICDIGCGVESPHARFLRAKHALRPTCRV